MTTFESNVIESARNNTNVQNLFYNNTIESMHFREKKEQSFKKENVNKVISTLQAIITLQQSDKIRSIYGLRSLSFE